MHREEAISVVADKHNIVGHQVVGHSVVGHRRTPCWRPFEQRSDFFT